MLFRFPQGSILGSLLFKVFICDMFCFLENFDIANHADDSTPHCGDKSAAFVVGNLKQSSIIFIE